MCETYYVILQPYFGKENIQSHYIDNNSFIISVNTKDLIKELKNLNILNKSDELFSNKNKKVIGKFKKETPKNGIIDQFVCLRSKMYSFKCRDDSKN